MNRPLVTSSLLLLLAASPAPVFAAPEAATDSQGNALHGASGACIGAIGSGSSSPGCALATVRQTFRILQGMVPQPYVTYTLPPPVTMLTPEKVSIALKQPWEKGSTMLSPTQREEIYAVMTQLETYRMIDGFEIVTYPGLAKDAGFNRRLAEQRAKTLTSFLASVGIPPDQIVSRVADPADSPRSELNVTVRGRR